MMRQNKCNGILDFTQKMCVFDGLLGENEKMALVFLMCEDTTKAHCILVKNLIKNSKPEKILPDLFSFLANYDRQSSVIDKFIESLIIIGNIQVVSLLGHSSSEINTLKDKYSKNSGHVNSVRKELFRMCEDLSIEELENLIGLVENDFNENKSHFHHRSPKQMEINILYWIQEGYISDGTGDTKYDVHQLIKHLHTMDKHNLAERLERVYFLNSREEILYPNTACKDNDFMLNEPDLKDCMKLMMPKSVIKDDDVYVMDINNMGLCIIVNQKNFSKEHLIRNGVRVNPVRHGTDNDRDMLEITFMGFGYEVVILENLDSVTFKKSIEEILMYRVLPTHSSLFLFILSHGKLGTVYGVDGIEVPVQYIDKMISEKCPKLLGKPKVHVIQACQGNEFQRAVPCIQEASEGNFKMLQCDGQSDVVKKVPPTADLLTYWSTVPGYASARLPFSGSVFIQTLCAQLLKYGDSKHLLDILTAVNHELSQKHFDCDKVVMPQISGCTMTKQLFFPYSPQHRFKAAKKLYMKYMVEHLIMECIIKTAIHRVFQSRKQK